MINRNIDGQQVNFLLASMRFTVDAMDSKTISPAFAVKRLRFDLETAESVIGKDMVEASPLSISTADNYLEENKEGGITQPTE